MALKKIIICLIIVIGLTGCGCSKSSSSEDNKTKDEVTKVTVNNGSMETINSKGFKIELDRNGENAIIVIRNDDVKKDQAYIIDLTINQKEGGATVQEAYIPANMPEPLKLNTNLKSEVITSIEYKITETKSQLKGNSKKA